MLYLLVITAILLILMVTPSRAEYVKGLWRARKADRLHLPWWDDLALNRVFLVIVCAVVLADATVASNGAAESARARALLGAAFRARFPWRSRRACWWSPISDWPISISRSVRRCVPRHLRSFLVPRLARAARGRHDSVDSVSVAGLEHRETECGSLQSEPGGRDRPIAAVDRAEPYSMATRRRQLLRPCYLLLSSTACWSRLGAATYQAVPGCGGGDRQIDTADSPRAVRVIAMDQTTHPRTCQCPEPRDTNHRSRMRTDMNWALLRDWIDNPIFIKHVRSRLRRQPLAAGMVVVVVLCMCIVWAGYENDAFLSGRAFEWLVMLQGIILIVMGASQVSAAVGGARLSGILDFHRVSPLTPAELTLGFFFGAPIREYVLFACTLPFAALFMAFGVPTVHGLSSSFIFLVAIAWVFHGLALLNSLVMKGRRSARGAVGAVIFFVLILFVRVRMGRFIPSMALFDEDGRPDFLRCVAAVAGGRALLRRAACCSSFIWRPGAGWARSGSTLCPGRRRSLPGLRSAVLMLGGVWQGEETGS